MGKYSETRYAYALPTFDPAPLPASEATAAQKSNMRVYETFADLPATSTSKGNTAFVKATNKLYVWNGVGWYLVAEVTNASPSSITGVNSTYGLATDGTATTITAVATDPEGMALTWSSSVTAGSLNGTTVSNVDNVFTVTPHASNATTFTLTFSVTDGVNSAVSYPSDFTLAFTPQQIGSDTIYTTGSGTYSIPSGANYVRVYVTGGGGGGGGASGSSGYWFNSGGAGAGGTIIGVLAVTSGQSITYTVGAAGTGGVGTNSGTDGGTSSLNYNSTDFAIGVGGDGSGGGGYSGAGGAANHTGMVSVSQNPGGAGASGSFANFANTGAGGASYYGSGGSKGNYIYSGNGGSATSTHYGAGGGGAGSNSGNSTGGAGAEGYIVIQAWTMIPT